ncbi:putative ribonuclease H-like domain-containing protein [Tanacetum coccineum]
MDFMSSPRSTNEVNTVYGVTIANTQVSPASTQVSTASTQVSTANLSDDTVYAFLASQLNRSQLLYEDLEQIHEDEIEEMELKWQLALLSMRTRRFFQKTSRKITINGSDTAGYDKSKVECFNCHKMGHFARECKGPRNQDSRNKNQDSSRRTINMEETSSKAIVAIDGAGFDWSYMVDDEVPTNMALMAFSDSEFNKSEFNLATYKRGLASVEEQLVFYKKNEVIFCEQLAVLKRDISYKDSEISMLKSELEKLKQEKESNQLKIENFDNASKSLDKLIGSQITDKSRKGVGFVSYNAVPPPHTGLFSPPKLDLSNSGLEEFQQPEFEGYGPKTSKSVSEDISNEVRESPDALLVKELVSDDKLEKKTVFPTVAKIEFVRPKQQEKPVRKLVKYAKMYSIARTPQQNGVAERRNRTLIEAVRTMLADDKCTDKSKITRKQSKTGKHGHENQKSTKAGSKARKVKPQSNPVLLKVPRKNNMYSVDMKNIIPKESLTYLVAKATLDESILWHRRLGHVNFKTINKLVKENLVRGLPTKRFENDQTCIACLKGKQHKASCKSKIQNSITQPLFMLHMDLFGLTFVSSLMNKKYCLVVTDDYSKFTWVFFLASKDETSSILKNFITEIENLVDKKVTIIRCDNGTEFKNRVMSEFCEQKGIKREFSVARTPQQNGVAERRNRTLIKAVRTMLADSKLPTTFWAEVVNTACHVQNRDTKPYIKLRSSRSVHWDQQVEVIKNGNKVLKRTIGETKQEYKHTTAEEKQDRRNKIKDRGTLLMALLNKDQLKFHSYKDAKLLMEAIKKRYGGNKESKKVQRTLLKQQYENFAGLSSEIMDQTFDSQPNSPHLAQEDLEQIDPNELEELDLQWEMAMLTIRARRFIKRTGRKAPRNQESRGREINKRTMTVETPTENALVAQDGIRGYDWSYQAEEEHPTNFALMAHTSSGSSSSSDYEVDSCSKSCVKLMLLSKNNMIVCLQIIKGNFIPFKPDLTFMDEIVKSENIDVITVVTPSNVKNVESNHESANVKNNGNAVEPKTVRMNSFRPPVIEDWNSNDDSEVEFIPNIENKTVWQSVCSLNEPTDEIKD